MSMKDWQRIYKMAKANGINTIGELVMYCKVWKIKTVSELILQLGGDYIEVLYDNCKKVLKEV